MNKRKSPIIISKHGTEVSYIKNKQLTNTIMKKLVTLMVMMIAIASFGQPKLPKGMRLYKTKIGGYIIAPERPSQPESLDRTDGHYFNIIPAIQGNKKEIEGDTLTNQEIDSNRYMYDEITNTIFAIFEDDNICYNGNEDALFREFLYNKCYECIDDGNNLYCEIYYYYNSDDDRLASWEKRALTEVDDEERYEIKNYKERCGEIKEIGLSLADQQRSLDNCTASYQSSLKNYKRRRDEIMNNHINIELRRAMYVRDIIYKSYPARIKYVKVTDPKQKNKITIVISNYKDEYRKN